MWPPWLARRCARFAFWGLPCSGCGGRNGWRVMRCARRSASYVAAVTCRDCGSAFFLKKSRSPGAAAACEAVWEYQVLERLGSEADAARTFLTPRVYGLCASTCAYSMQLLVGQPLDERLRAAADQRAVDDCLRLAAAWLRALHAHPMPCETGKDFVQLMQQVESNCAALAASDRLARTSIALLRENLAAVARTPVQPVPLHGDFKASNLIQTHAGVYGVDLGLRYQNAGTMDVAKFIADLLLNRRRMQAAGRHQELAHMVHVFMDAYGDTSPEGRAQVAWWLPYFLLSWWRRELDGWKPAPLVRRLYAAAMTDAIAYGTAAH